MADSLPDSAVARARENAPFLRDALARRPELVASLERDGFATALKNAGRVEGDLGSRLRREREGIALVVAIADLAGLITLDEVFATLTEFADRALDAAIREALGERGGDAASGGFAAIALGKQGSGELNYSSDIDPIFLFDPDTIPCRPREAPQQAAVRIGRRVLELLQTRTGEGYVLRVDLRLRPSPEVTPIAVPLDAAIAYYENSALPWERAAFIRARAAAGDRVLGCAFLDAIAPFVWRRTLDFGAVAEVTQLSQRIRDGAGPQACGPGFDLKRGRGGIREIEFFAQIHQLIHGGRDPSLRAPATLDALAALAAAGRIGAKEAEALADAYRALRTIEHRLQMIEDQQTHSLPEGEALKRVAALCGLEDGNALVGMLTPHVDRVAAIYGALLTSADLVETLPEASGALADHLTQLGFASPEPVVRLIAGWRQGGVRSLRSAPARAAFEAMLPRFLEAMSATADPVSALNRFGDIVARVPSGINLYRLIDARPGLLTTIADILGHAPALADQLAGSPQLLDGLIDASAFDPQPEVDALVAALAAETAGLGHEALLDTVRLWIGERRFANGAALISGQADPLEGAAAYARLAEAAIAILATATVARFAATHGTVPGGELAIVALGRLGGGAMTHASDLDLVYLFTGPTDASSDGAQPLRATDYYNRLARRVTAALAIPTAAGPLYEVDTRLRPSGVHGMLAVSADAFEAYQAHEAWTFEHMALTRARTLFGSREAKRDIDGRIGAILTRPRDRELLRADASEMRAIIARNKPAASEFDIKRGEGGLIDLEFAVHVRQLATGIGIDPSLGSAIAALIAAGQVPPEFAEHHRLLARLLVTLRLVAPEGRDPPAASLGLIARACRMESWAALTNAHHAAREAVAKLWQGTSGPTD